MQHTEGLYQSWTSKWERAVFCLPSFPSGCCKERRRAEVLYDWFDAVAGNLRFHLFVPFKTYYLLVQQKRVEESWHENIRNGMKMAYGGGLPGSSAHLPSVQLIHEYSCCAFMVGRCSSCNRESRLFAYGFLMNVSSFLQCRSTQPHLPLANVMLLHWCWTCGLSSGLMNWEMRENTFISVKVVHFCQCCSCRGWYCW